MDGSGARLIQCTDDYPADFDDPRGWRDGLISLISTINPALRRRIGALAVDGTSGTLLLCRADGRLLGGPLARALPYHLSCPEQGAAITALLQPDGPGFSGPAASVSGSLARALRLMQLADDTGQADVGMTLLRHQADWISGWFLGDWSQAEEGNNMRLGWDPHRSRWAGAIRDQPWAAALPRIRPSGTVLGTVHAAVARQLGLASDCRVVAGSTDANAAVLAAEPDEGDGITVLGTTLVLKQFVEHPIQGPGISCHRVAGRWLAGGASNTGAGILRRFFSDGQLRELSRQMVPERPSGLQLRPLMRPGERFPVDDPDLAPVLEPRPVSDVLYLQALLEGLAAIEAAGWQQLEACGAPRVRRVISVGGGAVNPQWRRMRQRALARPVLNRPGLTAALGMAQLARTALQASMDPPSNG
ncbi:MAG: FGGY-family carbohydrate kinase [Cyanobacteriota bacterium]